ncbi:S41 family peptidase [Patescibacteria group bacterium]|nr:S41 family peptidase [Patescibacteria group bacterium]
MNKISLHNILVALIFFGLGYISFGYLNHYRSYSSDASVNLDLFWEVYTTLAEKYPFEQPVPEDKIFGAIQGLVRSYGDDYSSFLPPSETKFFNQTITGEFGGIGAEIGIQSGYLTVISPLKESPAERAGLEPSDIIIQVDDQDVTNMSMDSAINLIRGEIGTNVTLTIVRFNEGEPFEVSIERENVTIPILETQEIESTFVISLFNFNETSENVFEDALKQFIDSGKSELLIDLRNNPGGLLTSAVDIASFFLDQGKVVLTEEYGLRNEDAHIYRSSGNNLLKGYDFETVVLINGGSASAAEILAGALRDHNKARIVGEQSFGKGSVQELIQLPERTSLKITVARWLTPSGNQISEVGIEPDVYIPFDSDAEIDTQLFKAISLFNTN